MNNITSALQLLLNTVFSNLSENLNLPT